MPHSFQQVDFVNNLQPTEYKVNSVIFELREIRGSWCRLYDFFSDPQSEDTVTVTIGPELRVSVFPTSLDWYDR